MVDGAVVVDFVVGFVDVGFGLDEVVFGFVVVRGARVVVVRGARVVGAVRVGAVVGATVVACAVGRFDEVVDVLEEDDELELDELDETDDEFDGVADVLDATEAGSWESLLLP